MQKNRNEDSTKKRNKLEHFKMQMDCSKCLQNGDDSDLRKFRRKVIEKLKVGENFRIYDENGVSISESDLYFLNQSKSNAVVVYVSNQSN